MISSTPKGGPLAAFEDTSATRHKPLEIANQATPPRLGWFERASGTHFTRPIQDLIVEYLPSDHPLRVRFEAPKVSDYAELIDSKAMKDFVSVTREDLVTKHRPGTLIAIRKPRGKYAYWAVVMNTSAYNGEYRIGIATSGRPPCPEQLPAQTLGLYDSRDNQIGDLYELALDFDAECFFPPPGPLRGGDAVGHETMATLLAGTKLILACRLEEVPGWCGEGAVLLGITGTTLLYKQPRPVPRWSERKDLRTIRTQFATPDIDYPGHEPWHVLSCDTKKDTCIVPHPFYRRPLLDDE